MSKGLKRRNFVKTKTLGCVALSLFLKSQVESNVSHGNTKLRFDICKDVNRHIMHDADSRLHTFINNTNSKNLDFII